MRGHDDSGQDIASGHLPFEMDGTSKFDSAEGSCVSATGLSLSSKGFAKCWSKFGGMELCKTRSAMGMNKQDAWKIRGLITIGALLFLSSKQNEECSAWYVSVPSLENGTLATRQKFVAEYDVANDLSDLCPMLSKETQYILTKFSVQRKVAEAVYLSLSTFFSIDQRCDNDGVPCV